MGVCSEAEEGASMMNEVRVPACSAAGVPRILASFFQEQSDTSSGSSGAYYLVPTCSIWSMLLSVMTTKQSPCIAGENMGGSGSGAMHRGDPWVRPVLILVASTEPL